MIIMNLATPMRLKSRNGKCISQEQLCFHHQGYCGPNCYHDFGTTMIIPSNHLINGSESAYRNGNVNYTTIESSGTNPFNNTLSPL
jgi:hypothetical protein